MVKLPANKNQKIGLIAFVVMFAVAGAALIIATRAASPVVSFEPEKATIVAPATACTDPGASNSGCVKFMPETTTPIANCNIYVSPAGGGNGSSQSSPTTLSSGMSSASTGGVVCLNNGSYGTVTLAKSITLRNTPGQSPVLTKITISTGNSGIIGLDITGGSDPLVRVNSGISNVLIKGNKIHDGSGNGMRSMANKVTIQDNEMYHFANEDAIRLWGDSVIIRNNYIHDVVNSGHNDPIQTWLLSGNEPGPAITNFIMEDNIVRNFTGSDGHCIMAESTTTRLQNWTIARNRFENIGAHCMILGGGESGDKGVLDVKFYYNQFKSIGGSTIICNWQTTGVLYGNTFTSASSKPTGSGTCPTPTTKPADANPTRPNYDVTWPI